MLSIVTTPSLKSVSNFNNSIGSDLVVYINYCFAVHRKARKIEEHTQCYDSDGIVVEINKIKRMCKKMI